MIDFTCGDGIKAFQTLAPLDLVFVDPPWMAGDREANGHRYKDSYSKNEYIIRYCKAITRGAEQSLYDGGTLAVWVDYRAAPYWEIAMDDSKLTRCGEVIVESELGNPGEKHWPMRHSSILLAYKGKEQAFSIDALPMTPRLSAPKMVGGISYEGDKRIGSIIRYTLSNTAPERCGYPDQKPLYVCKIIVEAFTSPGDRVFDPCCGSGSIPIAAHQLGRHGIGYDQSLGAIQAARLRTVQLTLF